MHYTALKHRKGRSAGTEFNQSPIFLSLLYFPDNGKSLPFDEFYNAVNGLGKYLSADFRNITRPLIGAGLPFPTETDDFFSAEMRCKKSQVYDSEKPFFQTLQDKGYHTILGYRHGVDEINIEEIKGRI